MKKLRDHLSYANVMSSLAIFLVLGGGAAIAAKNVLPKNSVGPQQLKKGAVRTADISAKAVKIGKIAPNAINTRRLRKNAVARGKVRNNAINGSKIADGSVTGGDIDAPSTPFGRVVHEARGNSTQALGVTFIEYPLDGSSYTQDADETNTFAAAVDVTFEANCAPPRSLVAYLFVDVDDPLTLPIVEAVGFGVLSDEDAGQVSRRMNMGVLGAGGPSALFEPGSDQQRKLDLVLQRSCNGGVGDANATFAGVDVIGTK